LMYSSATSSQKYGSFDRSANTSLIVATTTTDIESQIIEQRLSIQNEIDK
jgi:hypothetical protein